MFDGFYWTEKGLSGTVGEVSGLGLTGTIMEAAGVSVSAVMPIAIVMYVLMIVGAYFIGNISPSTLLAKSRGLDIKKEGSGNAGTTNALRVMGKKAGIITLVIDILKGVIAVVLPWIIAGEACSMWCAVAVIVGHVWPVIYKFKGGKGVATTFGALLAINPLLAIVVLLIVAAGVYISKIMSVGSVCGALFFFIPCLFIEPEFVIQGFILSVIVLFKHRANISRLMAGEEPKLGFLDKEAKAAAAAAAEAEANREPLPAMKQSKKTIETEISMDKEDWQEKKRIKRSDAVKKNDGKRKKQASKGK